MPPLRGSRNDIVVVDQKTGSNITIHIARVAQVRQGLPCPGAPGFAGSFRWPKTPAIASIEPWL